MSGVPASLGVCGAGTMGAGIAQIAAQAGMAVRLHDPVPGATERGIEQLRHVLGRGVERERLTREEADQALARIKPAATLTDLAGCGLVVEAAPEQLELKREL